MEVTVDEAQEKFAEIISRVESGESVVLTRDGKIVAILSPVGSAKGRRDGYGSMKGEIWMAEDFDAPLPDEMLKGIYE